MKIHTGVRPHACNICPKSFIQATQLRAHMFNHTGENGFSCSICDRSFSRKARLDAHMKKGQHSGARTKIKSDEEPHQSSTGKKMSIVKKKLTAEVDGVNPTETTCDICYKTFKNLDNLVRHMDGHRGIKRKIFSNFMMFNNEFMYSNRFYLCRV